MYIKVLVLPLQVLYLQALVMPCSRKYTYICFLLSYNHSIMSGTSLETSNFTFKMCTVEERDKNKMKRLR